MDKNNLKLLLADQTRLLATRADIEATALNAIKDKIALVNADLEAVTGLISEMVKAGAAQQRAAQAKEFGAVSFVNSGIKVTHTVPKAVTWDQAELSAIAARIAGAP